MTLSTHKCEVVQVHPKPHPNADRLEVVELFDGGYTCCAVKGQFAAGSLAAYLPPDAVVDTVRPEFAFLAKDGKTTHRVRAVKLRGVQSYGLLMAAPPGAKLGDDAAEYYGVGHYEPPLCGAYSGGEAERAPDCLSHLSKYDVDSLQRYKSVFAPGEPCYVSEKIHGASSRYAYVDGRMWCGSRGEWKRQAENNLWWKALAATPSIQSFCESHLGYVIYGEAYGRVQSLRYGAKNGEVWFAAFDVRGPDGLWLNAREFRYLCESNQVPCVPLLAIDMPFDFDALCAMAEGPSLVPSANHYREGLVCVPMQERWDSSCGRCKLKIVSAQYLAKSE